MRAHAHLRGGGLVHANSHDGLGAARLRGSKAGTGQVGPEVKAVAALLTASYVSHSQAPDGACMRDGCDGGRVRGGLGAVEREGGCVGDVGRI